MPVCHVRADSVPALPQMPQREGHTLDFGTAQPASEVIELTASPEHEDQFLWLRELINYFGSISGFEALEEWVVTSRPGDINVTAELIAGLLSPWAVCRFFLSTTAMDNHIELMFGNFVSLLENLTDKQLKNEKYGSISDFLCKLKESLRGSGGEEAGKSIDIVRLTNCTKLLQSSSFDRHMNVLAELKRLTIEASSDEGVFWLNARQLTEWFREHDILKTLLKSNLHHKQYVAELSHVILFLSNSGSLRNEDLDSVWESSVGKHEAIATNIHRLLGDIAGQLQPDHLDHLLLRFKESHKDCTPREYMRLLEVISTFAHKGAEAAMSNKVLHLLWAVTHDGQLSLEVSEKALSFIAHLLEAPQPVELLVDEDGAALADPCRDFVTLCVDKISRNECVIPSLRLLFQIFQKLDDDTLEQSQIGPTVRREASVSARAAFIKQLDEQSELIQKIVESVLAYSRSSKQEQPADQRYSHTQCITERLHLLDHVLCWGKELRLQLRDADRLWQCLVEPEPGDGSMESQQSHDRELAWSYFQKWAIPPQDGDEPLLLDDDALLQIFHSRLVAMHPSKLTAKGWDCFHQFFCRANILLDKLELSHRGAGCGQFVVKSVDYDGAEQLWSIALDAEHGIAESAIELLNDLCVSEHACTAHERGAMHDGGAASTAEPYMRHVDNTLSRLQRSWERGGGSEKAVDAGSSDSGAVTMSVVVGEGEREVEGEDEVSQRRILRCLLVLQKFVLLLQNDTNDVGEGGAQGRAYPRCGAYWGGTVLKLDVVHMARAVPEEEIGPLLANEPLRSARAKLQRCVHAVRPCAHEQQTPRGRRGTPRSDHRPKPMPGVTREVTRSNLMQIPLISSKARGMQKAS